MILPSGHSALVSFRKLFYSRCSDSSCCCFCFCISTYKRLLFGILFGVPCLPRRRRNDAVTKKRQFLKWQTAFQNFELHCHRTSTPTPRWHNGTPEKNHQRQRRSRSRTDLNLSISNKLSRF